MDFLANEQLDGAARNLNPITFRCVISSSCVQTRMWHKELQRNRNESSNCWIQMINLWSLKKQHNSTARRPYHLCYSSYCSNSSAKSVCLTALMALISAVIHVAGLYNRLPPSCFLFLPPPPLHFTFFLSSPIFLFPNQASSSLLLHHIHVSSSLSLYLFCCSVSHN